MNNWSFLWLLIFYLIGLLFFNVFSKSFDFEYWDKKRFPYQVILAILLFLPLVTDFFRNRDVFLKTEGISDVAQWAVDRLNLQETPSVYPKQLFSFQPQRVYLFDSRAKSLTLQFANSPTLFSAQALGSGLFFLDIDLKSKGEWPRTESGPITGHIRRENGDSFNRVFDFVAPFAHPRWFDSSLETESAVTVSEETSELLLLENSGKVLQKLATASNPQDAKFFSNGKMIAVSHRFDENLWIIDRSDLHNYQRTRKHVKLGSFQGRIAISPNEKFLAVSLTGSRNGISVVSLKSFAEIAFIELDADPEWISFGKNSNELILFSRKKKEILLVRSQKLNSNWQLNWEPHFERYKLSRPAVTVELAPDRKSIYFATTGFQESGIELPGNHFSDDTIIKMSWNPWRVERKIRTTMLSYEQKSVANLINGVSPMSMVFLNKDKMLISFSGSSDVGVYSQQGNSIDQYLDISSLSSTPIGLGSLGKGRWCFSSAADGTIVVIDQKGKVDTVHQLAPRDAELVSDLDRWLRRGEKVFYESTRSGISCQSCHTHGDSDYSLHNIGGMPESHGTLTAKGIAGTSPYLRDDAVGKVGTLFQHLNLEMFRGYATEVDFDRGRAISTFVEHLPRIPNPNHLIRDNINLQRRGLHVFEKAKCHLCHSYPAFTNLSRHYSDFIFQTAWKHETATLLDVPTLLGVRDTPPFMIDGRLENLNSVLNEKYPEYRHGRSDALSEREKSELVNFLKTL